MKEMFDKKGNVIIDGYSEHYDFNYNRNMIRCPYTRIKEWDFQDFRIDNYIFQYIVAHALIFDNYYVGLINIKTNERHYANITKLHRNKEIKLIDNPEKDYEIEYKKKNLRLSIKLKSNKHLINFNGIDQNGDDFSASVSFDSIDDANKICILHKFKESNKMFFLNYKENYFDCKLKIKSKTINVESDNAVGLIDHGRGYWPFISKWYWGNCSFILDGKRIGWNLGYGFGTSKTKENIIYYDNISYKIGNIVMNINENNPYDEYDVYEENGLLHLHFIPFFDNYSETKILFINKWCHQVFHKTSGYIIVSGIKHEFKDVISFMEYEENRW